MGGVGIFIEAGVGIGIAIEAGVGVSIATKAQGWGQYYINRGTFGVSRPYSHMVGFVISTDVWVRVSITTQEQDECRYSH